jgi:hypothetical protein
MASAAARRFSFRTCISNSSDRLVMAGIWSFLAEMIIARLVERLFIWSR